MKRNWRLLAVLAVLAVLVGCRTMAGAMVGGGIGYVAGDAKTGAAIGAGVGLMADIMK
jgi:hypothetical protein